MKKLEEKNRILEVIICILIAIILVQVCIEVYLFTDYATQNCVVTVEKK